jgi:hypothetical protein
MGGGLMQLVAYGAQDVYLTGNPQITFWKVTYRRYTNFAIESIEQTFNGQADFGRRVQCVISRNDINAIVVTCCPICLIFQSGRGSHHGAHGAGAAASAPLGHAARRSL